MKRTIFVVIGIFLYFFILLFGVGYCLEILGRWYANVWAFHAVHVFILYLIPFLITRKSTRKKRISMLSIMIVWPIVWAIFTIPACYYGDHHPYNCTSQECLIDSKPTTHPYINNLDEKGKERLALLILSYEIIVPVIFILIIYILSPNREDRNELETGSTEIKGT